jgi:hypothetical protein
MDTKLWIYDIKQLVNSFQLIPKEDDSYVHKLNTIVRLTIVATLLISFWKPELALGLLFAVSMGTVVSHASETKEEGFEDCESKCAFNTQTMKGGKTKINSELANQQLSEFIKEYSSSNSQNFMYKTEFPLSQQRFCNDEKSFVFDCSFESQNQKLAGFQNPKTKIAPIIAPRSHDLDVWKANDFVVNSNINNSTNFDQERSGYNFGNLPTKCKSCFISPCKCSFNYFSPIIPQNVNKRINSNLSKSKNCNYPPSYVNTNNCFPCSNLNPISISSNIIQKPEITCPVSKFQNDFVNPEISGFTNDGIENFSNINNNIKNYNENKIQKIIFELDENGINITNKDLMRKNIHQLFSERKLGKTQDDEIDKILQNFINSKMNNFESKKKDNLLTNTLVPGVYQKTHIGEPIQSNIGISYIQDWGPVEIQEKPWGIKFTEQDPKNFTLSNCIEKVQIQQDISNVYDPRLTGYGTSYRGYTDSLTGQPKFFYKDIDSITMPNFISRNNVDMFSWAPTYGPDKPLQNIDEYKQMANNSFVDSSIIFRTEMMERLMRKKNAENWQRRLMPLSKMNSVSSSSGIKSAV